MLSDGTDSFSWNARNPVATLNSLSLQYDAAGRRTKNLQNTSFLFDGANAVQELSGSTPIANLISGGIDEIFTRVDSTGAFTPLKDALGSTIALVDANGGLVTQYAYDPFGNTTVSGASSSNGFQYTGRENEGNGPVKRRKNGHGRPRKPNRDCFEGILWILQTGAAWRFLPEEFPSPST